MKYVKRSDDFKRSVVQQSYKVKNLSQFARSIGIPAGYIYSWRNIFTLTEKEKMSKIITSNKTKQKYLEEQNKILLQAIEIISNHKE